MSFVCIIGCANFSCKFRHQITHFISLFSLATTNWNYSKAIKRKIEKQKKAKKDNNLKAQFCLRSDRWFSHSNELSTATHGRMWCATQLLPFKMNCYFIYDLLRDHAKLTKIASEFKMARALSIRAEMAANRLNNRRENKKPKIQSNEKIKKTYRYCARQHDEAICDATADMPIDWLHTNIQRE